MIVRVETPLAAYLVENPEVTEDEGGLGLRGPYRHEDRPAQQWIEGFFAIDTAVLIERVA